MNSQLDNLLQKLSPQAFSEINNIAKIRFNDTVSDDYSIMALVDI